ncbi:MAG: glycoside hydrolase family 38 N-terminal domain-containing protein [Bacilli bacterium]
MKHPKRRWTVCVIHHAHTDIGYTERQEVIERFHADFIRQAVSISEAAHDGLHPQWRSFRWTCETFWGVERFLEQASPEERERFVRAVQRGDIELTGNYLNMTELIGEGPLRVSLEKAQAYAHSLGVTAQAAMTADINGYSWGYGQCLYDAGVRYLLSCIHTHHGMYPAGRTQTPFWWETPGGERILVWNGDHYNLGNELGISPEGLLTYTFSDEFSAYGQAANAYGKTADAWEVAELRLSSFLCQLEESGYPYDFVPVTVSGLITDNSPPNPAVIEFIHRWNDAHGESIELESSTLQTFFRRLEQSSAFAEIPVYRGDWPDWWSDGAASTPLYTQLFREAQRSLENADQLLRGLEMSGVSKRKPAGRERIINDLMLYAEHTWGHHASVSEPWSVGIQSLQARKQAYAVSAHRGAMQALDDALAAYGALPLAARRPLFFQAVNPYPHAIAGVVTLPLESWEAARRREPPVTDAATGAPVQAQLIRSEGKASLAIAASLEPGERAAWHVDRADGGAGEPDAQQQRTPVSAGGGSVTVHRTVTDGVADVVSADVSATPFTFTQTSLSSPFARVTWEPGAGIVSVRDLSGDRELVARDREAGAFTPVYEVTQPPSGESGAYVRSQMGRNRKGIGVQRTAGVLTGVRRVADGPVMATVELSYRAPGMRDYRLLVTLYADFPRLDAVVRIHKESVWEPENVYIALPFGHFEGQGGAVGVPQKEPHGSKPAGGGMASGKSADGEPPVDGTASGQTAGVESVGGGRLWLDKMGAEIRPGVDQLPGTCTDFYCVQDGFALVAPTGGVAVATPDTPLLQLGPLSYGPRVLHGEQGGRAGGQQGGHTARATPYAWVLNNFWETNFAPEAGGFYEFAYRVSWGPSFGDHREALAWCRRINRGILSFRAESMGQGTEKE